MYVLYIKKPLRSHLIQCLKNVKCTEFSKSTSLHPHQHPAQCNHDLGPDHVQLPMRLKPDPTSAWIPELGLRMQGKADIENGRPVSYAVAWAVVTVPSNQFANMGIRIVGKCVTPVLGPTIQLHLDFQAFVTACEDKRVLMADGEIDYTSAAFKQIEESYEVLLQDPLSTFLKDQQEANDYSWLSF